jgi:SAM-dependent methyltransferase
MVEVAAAAPGPCRPAVVVEGQRMHAGITEPKCQLLIERMQPSDVGQDHHAWGVEDLGRSAERGEPVAVAGLKDDPSSPSRAARHRRHRRASGGPMAHAQVLLATTRNRLVSSRITSYVAGRNMQPRSGARGLLLGGSGSETRKGLRRPPSRVGWGWWDARSARQRTLAAMPPTPPSDQAPASGLRIARHYSSEAQAYRDLWAPVLVGLARWLVEELPLAETRRVLDLGCGVGALLPHLDRVAPRALVVGLDRAEGMVALGPRDFPLLVGDAAELPFAAGSFDAVVMAFMLFHLPRPTAGLAEAWRVLRPGGWIGLLTWGKERESRAWRQWVEELDAEGAAEVAEKLSWHELVNTPQKVNGELQAAGFTVAVSRSSRSSNGPPVRSLSPGGRVSGAVGTAGRHWSKSGGRRCLGTPADVWRS